jgi:hypothetical protein
MRCHTHRRDCTPTARCPHPPADRCTASRDTACPGRLGAGGPAFESWRPDQSNQGLTAARRAAVSAKCS